MSDQVGAAVAQKNQGKSKTESTITPQAPSAGEKEHIKNRENASVKAKKHRRFRLFKFIKDPKVQIFLIIIVFVLGMIGYGAYYKKSTEYVITDPRITSLYSTLKLFAASFDAVATASVPAGSPCLVVLEIARWIALLVSGTALFTIAAPYMRSMKAKLRRTIWQYRSKKLLIIGNNEDNIQIYRNSNKQPYHKVILCKKGSDVSRLDTEEIPYIFGDATAFIEHQLDISKKRRKSITIVINTGSEAENLRLSTDAANKIRKLFGDEFSDAADPKDGVKTKEDYKLDKKKAITEKLDLIRIAVLADSSNEELYLQLQRQTLGLLTYTNKYIITSEDFVEKHPFTEFMRGKSIIDENGLIPGNLSVNVMLIGFGQTNQHIYAATSAVNQFITAGKKGQIPRLKPVNYYIFDKDDAARSYLNHSCFRYETEFLEEDHSGDAFYPFPDKPANVYYDVRDINDAEFYRRLRKIIVPSDAEKRSINYIIIAFGKDMENLELAQRLSVKKHEWGLDNLCIFVKVRDKQLQNCSVFLNSASENDKDYIAICNEGENIFDIDEIIDREILRMAKSRSFAYEKSSLQSKQNEKKLTDDEIKILTNYRWHNMDPNKAASNIYDILSIRFKLDLMGVDARDDWKTFRGRYDMSLGEKINKNNKQKRLDFSAIETRILRDERAHLDSYITFLGEDTYNRYELDRLDFSTIKSENYRDEVSKYLSGGTLRANMMVQEHYRWNAFMISKGFVPVNKGNPDNKDYRLRYHKNLTTCEGLIDYDCDHENGHVIGYDAQVIDNLEIFIDELRNGDSVN